MRSVALLALSLTLLAMTVPRPVSGGVVIDMPAPPAEAAADRDTGAVALTRYARARTGPRNVSYPGPCAGWPYGRRWIGYPPGCYGRRSFAPATGWRSGGFWGFNWGFCGWPRTGIIAGTAFAW